MSLDRPASHPSIQPSIQHVHPNVKDCKHVIINICSMLLPALPASGCYDAMIAFGLGASTGSQLLCPGHAVPDA